MSCRQVVIATNNGDIGGGEVMLFALAKQLRTLNVPVKVLAPAEPSALADEARRQGHDTVVLPASTRRQYMVELRRWRRRYPEPLLWCNGLVPSLATAGLARRLVHLHQLPTGVHALLTHVARFRALATVVPSRFVSRHLHGSFVLENWVDEVPGNSSKRADDVIRLGFLGRLSCDKGVDVLADALAQLDDGQPGRYRLLLAGEPRFVSANEQEAVEEALKPISHLVDMAGWVTPTDFFASIDLLVCPSVTAEAFGLVVAESMSARVPFVISDAGALPEVAGDDYPWVFPAGDAQKLAIAVHGATSADQAENVDRSYERWRSQYSPAAAEPHVGDLLRRLGSETKSQKRG